MPVTTTHPEYDASSPIWRQERDTTAGQFAVKAGREIYLPIPNASDESKANKDRYQRYLDRALFYPVVERTLNGLVGMVFRKPPVVDIPDSIDYLLEDTDGQSRSLEQLSKELVTQVVGVGRVGGLVDMPQSPGEITREQERLLNLRPSVAVYPAESIINWKTEKVGAQNLLTLVVLAEVKEQEDNDEYSHDCDKVYRVLRLTPEGYEQQLYDDGGTPIGELMMPTDASGARLREIPFQFIGSDDNRPNVDIGPLYGLSNLAVAYWQTSADHRENLYTHGQLTLGVRTSLSKEQFDKFNPNGVQVGANTGMVFGENGGFDTASAPESSSLRVALQDLREEMREVGARIITEGGQAETAEAARINASGEASILTTVVGNCSEGIEQLLKWCAMFAGADPEQVEFELNTEFFDIQFGPEMRKEWQSEIAARLRSPGSYKQRLQQLGEEDPELTLEELDQKIADETADDMVEVMDLGSTNEQ